MTIYLACKVQIALLIVEEVIVLAKYLDFADVFSKEFIKVLLKRTGIKENAIKLEKGKQPPYGPIYSLGLVELKTFKTYIKINLANSFILSSKSSINAPMLFVYKPDNRFGLCVDYCGLNNLTIKNQYPLPLIGESLDWLD